MSSPYITGGIEVDQRCALALNLFFETQDIRLLAYPDPLSVFPELGNASFLTELGRETLNRAVANANVFNPFGEPEGYDQSTIVKGNIPFFALSGKKASGKTTFRKVIQSAFPDVGVLPEYMTRPPREDEVEGVDLIYVPEREFLDMVDAGKFHIAYEVGRNVDESVPHHEKHVRKYAGITKQQVVRSTCTSGRTGRLQPKVMLVHGLSYILGFYAVFPLTPLAMMWASKRDWERYRKARHLPKSTVAREQGWHGVTTERGDRITNALVIWNRYIRAESEADLIQRLRARLDEPISEYVTLREALKDLLYRQPLLHYEEGTENGDELVELTSTDNYNGG